MTASARMPVAARPADPPAENPGPAAPERVDRDLRGAVDRVLRDVFRDRRAEALVIDPVFDEHIARRLADFALGGGARRRSALLWWGWRACRGQDGTESAGAVLDVAAALELVQCCALVQDDVMDGSGLRRGRPAVHAELAARHATGPRAGGAAPFGFSAAVLVGDLALAWADDLVADAGLTPAARDRLRPVWRAMRTEMAAGQYLDLHAQVTASRSPGRAMRTAFLKSARYSVESPLGLGAALAGADPAVRHALRDAGRCAGLAFQLRDDLLGVFGDPLLTGKPTGDDIREGKVTYLVAIAVRRARRDPAALRVLEDALGDPALSPAALDRVREVLVATGAREYVEARADRLADACRVRLLGASLEPAARDRLLAVLAAATGRGTGQPEAGSGHPETGDRQLDARPERPDADADHPDARGDRPNAAADHPDARTEHPGGREGNRP
ncbi:polyprenyl synthetase family protein [Streptomyces polygonati]|uniref:Polyprenyl synthetase family protein n=1 Tax=Streptomyces polygonati TaxID=1617087 RepID=A0ABV8HIX7_9ACTN